jgi:hypothetical protein
MIFFGISGSKRRSDECGGRGKSFPKLIILRFLDQNFKYSFLFFSSLLLYGLSKVSGPSSAPPDAGEEKENFGVSQPSLSSGTLYASARKNFL